MGSALLSTRLRRLKRLRPRRLRHPRLLFLLPIMLATPSLTTPMSGHNVVSPLVHSVTKRDAEPTPEADPWPLYSNFYNRPYYYNTYGYGLRPYVNRPYAYNYGW